MKGDEFLEKMELIEASYIEEADATVQKRRSAAVRWGALAACFIVAAVGALFIAHKPSAVPDAPVPAPDSQAQTGESIPVREKEPEVCPSHTILHPGNVDYVHPIYTPEPDDPTKPDTEYDYDTGYVVGGPFNYEDSFPVTPCISSYKEGSNSADVAVANGGVCYSDSLNAAMDHHGDSVTYRVRIVLFADGVSISSTGDRAKSESERLFELGYTTAIGDVTQADGSKEYHFSLLYATYEQLKNFPAADDLGYLFVFYDEYEDVPSDPDIIVFNGFEKAEKRGE